MEQKRDNHQERNKNNKKLYNKRLKYKDNKN